MQSDDIAVVRINTSEAIAVTGLHASNAAPTLRLSFGY